MTRPINQIVVALFCGAIGLPAVAAGETLESVEQKLVDMARKISSLSEKVHTEQVLGEGSHTNITIGDGTIEYVIAGDKYLYREEIKRNKRIEYKGKTTNEPNSFLKVCDGQFTWKLNVALGTPVVTKEKKSPVPDPNPLTSFKDQYNLTLLKDEDLSGRPCWVIEAAPKPPLKHPWPSFKIRFWFDKDLGVMMKKVVYDLKGKPMTTNTYADIRTNSSISPDRFRFEPPPNCKIFDETTGDAETIPVPQDQPQGR